MMYEESYAENPNVRALLDNLIEIYETSEELSIDDILSGVLERHPLFSELNLEDTIDLKRRYLSYVKVSEEISFLEDREERYNSVQENIKSEVIPEEVRKAIAYPRDKKRPHKKYNQAFINNISVPNSLEELYSYFMDGNDAQQLAKDIQTVGKTCWTVPRWAQQGDIVLFMHAKYAKSTLTRLRTEVRSLYSPQSLEAQEFERAIADQLSFHKAYGGKIFAVGRLSGKPKRLSVDPLSHSKNNIFCDIDKLFLLNEPVDISEFNSFIKISRMSGITPVFGRPYEKLKDLISEKNHIPKYFYYSVSTPFPYNSVNKYNWMRLGLQYRNSFSLEIQFRQCYVDYLLKELGDQKTIFMECPCYKDSNPVSFADNVIRINKKMLPVEVKLNIKLESDLEGQCAQYCKLYRLVLNPKKGREATMEDVIDDKVLVIDIYAVYIFYFNDHKTIPIFELDTLKSREDIQVLRKKVLSCI